MKQDRFGAASLLLGALGVVAIMAAHPTPADFAPGPQLQANLVRNLVVHGGGIASTALLTFGFWRFSQPPQRSLAQLAFAFFLFAAVPWTFAAIMSGLVMTSILPVLSEAEGPTRENLLTMASLTGRFNMAYAAVYATMSSAAFILWGLAWAPQGGFGWVLRSVGIVVGAGTILVFFSGLSAQLDVHGWLAIVVAQFVFVFCCAVPLWHGARERAAA